MPCDKVTVDEPTPDVSSLQVSSVTATSPGANQISVSYTVENVIESGNGETLTGTVNISANGQQLHSHDETLSPGESSTFNMDGADAPSGTYDVCVVVS